MSASFSAFSTAVATAGGSVPSPGSGSNIAGDPRFTDPAGGDFSLQQSSPLVDKGDQAGVVANEKDLTAGARVLDGDGDGTAMVDIGEFEHTYVPPFKKLTPGTYRIVLAAIDGPGNRSKQISRALKVKRHT